MEQKVQTNQETNDWERKKVGVIRRDTMINEEERDLVWKKIRDNLGSRSLNLNSIRNSKGSHAPQSFDENIWKMCGLLCCYFYSISFYFFSFIFFSSFPNNICRGGQNKIRKIGNEKQVFIPPYLSLPHYSVQRQLFSTTDVFRSPRDYLSVSK